MNHQKNIAWWNTNILDGYLLCSLSIYHDVSIIKQYSCKYPNLPFVKIRCPLFVLFNDI